MAQLRFSREENFFIQTVVMPDGERMPWLYQNASFRPIVPVFLYVILHRRYQRFWTILRDVRVLT